MLLLLIRSGKEPEQLGRKMIAMLRDETQHHVWREYTVQFIPDFFNRNFDPADLNQADEILMKGLTEVLWQMTEETQASLSGTALIKLNDLSQNFSNIDQKRLREVASQMATDESIDSASRMGVIRVLTERNSVDQVDAISQIALNQEAPVTLRMLAINSALKL